VKKVLDVISQIDPIKSAEIAELQYVNDLLPGITRKKSKKGFIYLDQNKKQIKDKNELKRIKALIIPPAWTDVWICPDKNGHLQATGRDSKGRKQYRYHLKWQKIRNELKFDKMLAFGKILPRLRRKVKADIELDGLPRDKILALVISIMEETLIRIGNREYVNENNTFGLTTMQNKHVEVDNYNIEFKFRGKSGKYHNINFRNAKLAKLIKRCRELPGYSLFEYLDNEGNPHSITSTDLNKYIYDITGQDFTAKDYRTWGGSVYAMEVFSKFSAQDNNSEEIKKNIVTAIKLIASRLGNTTNVCKKYYIHPAVLDAYLDGTLNNLFRKQHEPIHFLQPEETAFMALLEQRLTK
jgi:DNA topoisomerase-1